jgi:hypothetical protein
MQRVLQACAYHGAHNKLVGHTQRAPVLNGGILQSVVYKRDVMRDTSFKREWVKTARKKL